MANINETISVASTISRGVDPTLKIEGKAADAKATGLAIAAAVKAEEDNRVADVHRVEDMVAELLGGGDAGTTVETIAQRVFYEQMSNIYPVGAVYVTFNDTNPAETFGFGSWEMVSGRFLLGADSGDDVDEVGGSAEYTHTHGQGRTDLEALTIAQMPEHDHGEIQLGGDFAINHVNCMANVKDMIYIPEYDGTTPLRSTGFINVTSVTGYQYKGGTKQTSVSIKNGVAINASHQHNAEGEGAGHSHGISPASVSVMPPYIYVYIWRRVR